MRRPSRRDGRVEEISDEIARALRRLPGDRIVAVRQVDVDALDDPARPFAHHQDPIGHDDGLRQIMRDQKRGDARRLDRRGESLLQDELGLRIQGGKGLVEQDQAGIDGERPGQGDPLPLATRQLVGKAVREFRDTAAAQLALRALAPLGLAHRPRFEAELDVLLDAAPRQQQVLLQHEADVGARPVDRASVEPQAAFRRTIEAGDEIQDRALAASRGADDRDELARLQREGQFLDRRERRNATASRRKPPGHRIEVERIHGIQHVSSSFRRRRSVHI